MSGLWLRHAANFGEHPKTLRLRRLAGRQADAAECGWWRVLEAAKRYGSWTFDDEEHLVYAAGRYANLIPLYRMAGFLDGLTIHNGEEYQAAMSGSERVARHRANAGHVTATVTPVTPREEKSREERAEQVTRVTHDGLPNLDKAAIRALEERTGHTASQAGDKQLNEYDRLVGDHGLPATLAAFDTVRAGKRMTARQLVWGAVRVLEPFVDPKALAKDEREAERQQASRRGIERTQAYLADLRGETA